MRTQIIKVHNGNTNKTQSKLVKEQRTRDIRRREFKFKYNLTPFWHQFVTDYATGIIISLYCSFHRDYYVTIFPPLLHLISIIIHFICLKVTTQQSQISTTSVLNQRQVESLFCFALLDGVYIAFGRKGTSNAWHRESIMTKRTKEGEVQFSHFTSAVQSTNPVDSLSLS